MPDFQGSGYGGGGFQQHQGSYLAGELRRDGEDTDARRATERLDVLDRLGPPQVAVVPQDAPRARPRQDGLAPEHEGHVRPAAHLVDAQDRLARDPPAPLVRGEQRGRLYSPKGALGM